MRSLSIHELRKQTSAVIDAVQRGERFILTYRGRAVARLEPVRGAGHAVPDDDPLLRVDDFAVVGRGGRLRNEDSNRAIYGR